MQHNMALKKSPSTEGSVVSEKETATLQLCQAAILKSKFSQANDLYIVNCSILSPCCSVISTVRFWTGSWVIRVSWLFARSCVFQCLIWKDCVSHISLNLRDLMASKIITMTHEGMKFWLCDWWYSYGANSLMWQSSSLEYIHRSVRIFFLNMSSWHLPAGMVNSDRLVWWTDSGLMQILIYHQYCKNVIPHVQRQWEKKQQTHWARHISF